MSKEGGSDPPEPELEVVRPYSSFSSATKWAVVLQCGFAGCFSTISSNIYAPAIPVLSEAFGVTSTKINLTVTVYLVFQAITPAFFGALSDSHGRRPVYLFTLIIYFCSCIGIALTPTNAYWLLMLLRCLQATGGSAVIAIGAGCVSDIAAAHERGTFLGVFSAGTNIGPSIGPAIGGILAETLGWRSIFWFLTIASAVCLIPMFIYFPETLRSLVGDGSYPPPTINLTPLAMIKRKRRAQRGEAIDMQEGELPQRKKFAVLDSFLILLNPDILFIMVYVSLIYAEYYCVLTVLSTVLKDRYQYNNIIIGVCYVPNGVGAFVANLSNGRLLDWFYRRERQRVGADLKDAPNEFKLERARLYALPVIVPVFHAACIGMGWALQTKTHIAVTVIMNFFVGLAGAAAFSVATVFSLDMMPGRGGAVTAAFNLIRCMFGAVGTAVIQLLYRRFGAGWTFVLISGISVAATPLPLAILKYGPGWRRARNARNERAIEKALAKELASR